jgi:hypothetical protein
MPAGLIEEDDRVHARSGPHFQRNTKETTLRRPITKTRPPS